MKKTGSVEGGPAAMAGLEGPFPYAGMIRIRS